MPALPGAVTYEPPPGSVPTLPVPDLSGIRRVHLVGIGGAGMSGIARLLLARGMAVSGSDLKEARVLEDLRGAGARVFVGHRPEQLGDPDAVVISSAIPEANPELREARRRGIPVLARAQVLAALCAGKRTLAVSGTHGKTTTTSMLTVILSRAGLDPTFVVGGDLNEIGSGARPGTGEWFVAEADESDGSFLLLRPDVAVVTNVEPDHLDFYAGAEEIQAAFARFVGRAERVVACGDDPGTLAALALAGREAVTFGLGPGNDAVVSLARADRSGAEATLTLGDGRRVTVTLPVPGVHNLLNAAAAILASREAGVDPETAGEALRSFPGVRRRFEYRGTARGADFFDDYAHHPTEVRATLAVAAGGSRRVVAVFQPHRYTRTEALWRPLGESLAGADVVVVTDVYGAGEEPIPGVSGKLLVDALAETHPARRVVYLPRPSDVVRFLLREVREGDVVLTLGAGDITVVAEATLERLREAT